MALTVDGALILASSSPRRIEILNAHGLAPVVIPAETEEQIPICLSVQQAVMFLALKKALRVEQLLQQTPYDSSDKTRPSNTASEPSENLIAKIRCVNEPIYIIAADTVVYKDKIIGKPLDMADAIRILNYLRATDHLVYTGVAIVKANVKKRRLFYESTRVFFKDYTEADLYEYLHSDEPYDKAGAYAVQGAFGRFIDRIDGDRDNVIGFPWSRFLNEFTDFYNL